MLIECCIGEKAWNPYYALLALRLCGVTPGAAAQSAPPPPPPSSALLLGLPVAAAAVGCSGEGGAGGGGSVGRAHRVTAQYTLWDRIKEAEVRGCTGPAQKHSVVCFCEGRAVEPHKAHGTSCEPVLRTAAPYRTWTCGG